MPAKAIPFRRGLSWRLAFWVLLFSLVVTVSESAIQLRAKYLGFLADKEREFQEIGEVNLTTLSNSAWNLNIRSLELQLDGLRQIPDVELAEVASEGKILATSGQVVSSRRLTKVYPLNHDFRGAPRTLGELRVVMGLDQGWRRLWRQALDTVTLETARTMLLAAALLLIFYSMVARHLRRMAEHAGSLTVNELGRPLVLDRAAPRRRGPDELDMLCGALESMRANLAGSVAELRETNGNLRAEVARREAAEAALRATRSFLQNIVDSMPSAVIGFAEDLTVTHTNAMAEALGGLGPDQALGLPLAQAFPLLAPYEDLMRQAMRDRVPVQRQRLRLAPADSDMIADLVIYPLRPALPGDKPGDESRGVVVRLDDATQRAGMEAAMIQSEKMASLGSLAAGMAHEINNPLAGVLHTVQSLTRRLTRGLPANDKVAQATGLTMDALEAYLKKRAIPELLAGVRESGERAARIVGNMLKFARQSPQQHEPEVLAEIVDAALELAQSDYDLKKKYDFKRVRVVRSYAPDLPKIPCSAQEVEQVVLNILKNAAQAFSDPCQGGSPPTLTLSTRAEDGHAVIEIGDNGPGMNEEIRRRVFEPFFTTKQLGHGTGLGLSVSYFIIAQNHGGSIEVDSAPGRGATFVIRLPVQKVTLSRD